jgi:anti-anti-sigma regulatory factor
VAGLGYCRRSKRRSRGVLGHAFGQQGLGLVALVDAQAAAIEIIAGRLAGAAQPIGIVTRYFSELINSFVIAEQTEMEQQRAEIVIIDITGVSVIDTSTANHLLMTTRAVNLLGSRVVSLGIGAEIAQTIVHLGVELYGLITLADLQAGIAYALRQIGLGIQPLHHLPQANAHQV